MPTTPRYLPLILAHLALLIAIVSLVLALVEIPVADAAQPEQRQPALPGGDTDEKAASLPAEAPAEPPPQRSRMPRS